MGEGEAEKNNLLYESQESFTTQLKTVLKDKYIKKVIFSFEVKLVFREQEIPTVITFW